MTKLNSENFLDSFLKFEDRQAGVSLVYCSETQQFFYNVYCLETQLLKELYSKEYSYLEEALEAVHEEFGTWELKSYDAKKSSCGTCIAK